MREATSEKDLKRLMANVSLQLDAIKRGYYNFKDAQVEILKEYPNMIKDEIIEYKNALLKFFNLIPNENLTLNQESQDLMLREVFKEVLKTESGSKFYVNLLEKYLDEKDMSLDSIQEVLQENDELNSPTNKLLNVENQSFNINLNLLKNESKNFKDIREM